MPTEDDDWKLPVVLNPGPSMEELMSGPSLATTDPNSPLVFVLHKEVILDKIRIDFVIAPEEREDQPIQ